MDKQLVPAGPTERTPEKTMRTERLATLALVVAALSMLSAITNSAFTIWRYKQSQASNILVRCRLKTESPIQVVATNGIWNESIMVQRGPVGDSIQFAQNLKGAGIGSIQLLNTAGESEMAVDLTKYPKLARFLMECLLKNEGEKPVSVESFEVVYMFRRSNTVWVAVGGLLPIGAVYEPDLKGFAKMPYKIPPGEEISLIIGVEWPLEEQAVSKFEQACPGQLVTGEVLGELLSCLDVNQLKLSDNPGWEGTRDLRVIAVEAGGIRLHGGTTSFQLYESGFR